MVIFSGRPAGHPRLSSMKGGPRWQRRLARHTDITLPLLRPYPHLGDGDLPIAATSFEEVFPDDPGWPGRLDSNWSYYVYDRLQRAGDSCYA